jgi:hypothetical protein
MTMYSGNWSNGVDDEFRVGLCWLCKCVCVCRACAHALEEGVSDLELIQRWIFMRSVIHVVWPSFLHCEGGRVTHHCVPVKSAPRKVHPSLYQ